MKGSLSRAALAGVVGLTLFAAGCTKDTPPSTPAERPPAATVAVQVAEAKRGSLSSQLSYSGNVLAKQQVAIVPKVAGRITKLHVDLGSVVQPGDIMLELDDDVLAAQVAQAEAGLAAAQARLSGLEAGPRSEQVGQAEANLRAAEARLAQLKAGPTEEQRRVAQINIEAAKVRAHAANIQKDGDCNPIKPEYLCKASEANAFAAGNAIDGAQAQYDSLVAPATPEQLAQAQAAVDAARQQLALAKEPTTTYDRRAAGAAVAQARAAVDIAKTQLGEATIRAPFAGVIAQRMVADGSMAGPTSPLFTLISHEVEVVVNVEEGNLALLTGGLAGTITTGAYPGEQFKATVVAIAPSVDPRSRTVPVRLTPEDAQGKLRDGMFAQVRLGVGAAKENTLLVPAKAVVNESGEAAVYVVKSGKAERRPVTIGATDGERTEITAGLTEAEPVAVTGLSTLQDGQEVSIR